MGLFYLMKKMRKLTMENGYYLNVPDQLDGDLDDQVISSYTGIMIMMITGKVNNFYRWGIA